TEQFAGGLTAPHVRLIWLDDVAVATRLVTAAAVVVHVVPPPLRVVALGRAVAVPAPPPPSPVEEAGGDRARPGSGRVVVVSPVAIWVAADGEKPDVVLRYTL